MDKDATDRESRTHPAVVQADGELQSIMGITDTLGVVIALLAFGLSAFIWFESRYQRRADLTIRLFQIFEEMHSDRMHARSWIHEVRDSPENLRLRVALLWNYCILDGAHSSSSVAIEDLIKLRRVIYFFESCEALVKSKKVDERLFRDLVGHTFRRWSEIVIEPVLRSPRFVPNRVCDLGRTDPIAPKLAFVHGFPILCAVCKCEKPTAFSTIWDEVNAMSGD